MPDSGPAPEQIAAAIADGEVVGSRAADLGADDVRTVRARLVGGGREPAVSTITPMEMLGARPVY